MAHPVLRNQVPGQRPAQLTQTTGCQNTDAALKDDGKRAAFLSDCDLVAGQNGGGLKQTTAQPAEHGEQLMRRALTPLIERVLGA